MRGAKQKRRHLVANTARVSVGTEFRACYRILDKVYTFKYLDRILYFYESDWPVIARDLYRAWNKWLRFYHLLVREGGDTRTSRKFYVAVIQSVLIFGSEF